MNRRGRISLLGIVGLLCALVVVSILFLGRESLTTVGNRFMAALGKGDLDTLTNMTFMGNASPEEIRKQWDFTVNTAGRYYNFQYRIVSASQANERTGSVRMQVRRNSTGPSTYEENYQLPLVKVGDQWKVDVRGISRELYPALPQ